MKIISITTTIFFSVIILSACQKKFLEKSDPVGLSTSVFYKDSVQMEQAVSGVYGNLQEIANTQWLLNEQPSDNTTIDFNPLSRGGADGQEPFEYWTVNASNPYITEMYNLHYSTIYSINNALMQMGNATISDATRSAIEGQLKFVRAYLYFELVQYFGDVVLLTEPLSNPEDAFQYTRESQDQVYEQIVADLTDASAKLPASYPPSSTGKATRGAALTLLGKVHLTRHQFAEAIAALMPVLSLGYSLVQNYTDVFDPTKKNGPESIFDIQYQSSQGGNDNGEWSSFIYTFAPRNSADSVTGFASSSPSGYNNPSNDIINAYEPGDLRKDASIGLNVHSKETSQVVPYIKKYAHPHANVGRTDDNWPVLRYADVLLMLAEAINEQSGPGEAYGYINQVRDRAGLDDVQGLDQASFRDTVYHERRVELAFENWRFFDLKRTKTPAELAAFMNSHGAREKASPTISRQGFPFQGIDYIFDQHEYFYPIPNRELLINDKLTQNDGY